MAGLSSIADCNDRKSTDISDKLKAAGLKLTKTNVFDMSNIEDMRFKKTNVFDMSNIRDMRF
jgi:hypothetical protein